MLYDDRIDASVNLDGSLIYSEEGREFGEVTERGLDRPFMLVGAGIALDIRKVNSNIQTV